MKDAIHLLLLRNETNKFYLSIFGITLLKLCYNKYMEMIDKEILDCKLCGELEKLKCNSLQIGKSRILVLGESPSKDGWIVSGRAFFNSDGKLQASGKILNKLLNICGINIEDVNFTECCKCIISDRKRLRECIKNCRSILFTQLENLDFDIILPMGQYPSEVILDRRVKRLKDIIGKEFRIKIGNSTKLVIPIYHTSPISPLSFKGNEPIFKDLKSKLNLL